MGDFYSKTSNRPDYIIPDDSLIKTLSIEENGDKYKYMFDYEKLLSNNIPLERTSQCESRINNLGYKMLNFCKQKFFYSKRKDGKR